MDFLKILAGLLVAGVALYVRSAYLLAQRQRLVATRLQAYLFYWMMIVKERDYFSFYHLGTEWNSEEREIVKKGEGAKGLVRLENEKRILIKMAIEALVERESDNPSDDRNVLETLKNNLAKSPSTTVDQLLKNLEQFEQNLLDGKTFINDDDATVLGPFSARICIRLKMNIISIVNKALELAIPLMTHPESLSPPRVKEVMGDGIWCGVMIAKDIDTLSKKMERQLEKSILLSTWENLKL